MILSINKSVGLSDGNVTLFDSFTGVAKDLTISDPESKIATLESINECIRRNGRSNLNLVCEAPIVKCIIETFESKNACLEAIRRYISNDVNHIPLVEWTTDVWGEDEGNDPDKEAESVPASPGGSLFSESDEPENIPDRVRPITLRPRKTPAPSEDIKSEFRKSQTPVKTENRAENKNVARRSAAGHSKAASSGPEGSSESISAVARPKLKSANSYPTLRHVSSRSELGDEYSPEIGKKRAYQETRNGTTRPESRLVKRTKSDDSITRNKTVGTSNVVALRSEERVSPGLESVIKVLDNISRGNQCQLPEDNKQFVSRFWKETVSGFPPSFQNLSTLEHLGYIFRELELLRRENELIKRDEMERRKTMLLLADKIKLMNQPVLRCSKDTKEE